MSLTPYQVTLWSPEGWSTQQDWLAQEVPVALVYNGISHVVMMCSPQNLDAFALGFSLSEGIIQSPQQIYAISVKPQAAGIEVHIELSSRCFMALKQHRRSLAGRTGCGICGTEQLSMLRRPEMMLPSHQQFSLSHLAKGLAQLTAVQAIGQQTACTHVAAWLNTEGQLEAGFEDIGRHVALDKLLGARATADWGKQGCVLISSRASYEMVQKAVACQVEILCAASAATELAVDIAQQHGLTLVGFSRAARAVVYTHGHRISS